MSRNLDDKEDVYTIAISSYALHATRHPSQQTAMNLLELKAQTKNGTKFWAEEIPPKEERNLWHHLPKSLDIETTAYALLTYTERGLVEDSIPVLNWLIAQQNPFGGFSSTRDTVVALQALSMLMSKITQTSDMQVKFTYKKQESKSINVNRDNAWIVQQHKVKIVVASKYIP